MKLKLILEKMFILLDGILSIVSLVTSCFIYNLHWLEKLVGNAHEGSPIKDEDCCRTCNELVGSNEYSKLLVVMVVTQSLAKLESWL